MLDVTKLIRCTSCQGQLTADAEAVRCLSCDNVYALVDGVVCFGESDSFYDEYAEDECPYGMTPKGLKATVLRILPFWSYREWKFWSEVVPKSGALLDIGAGRGKEIFLERAESVVGIDGSLKFLKDCVAHYDAAILASLPILPFADNSFDTVVSSHVIGHVPDQDKDTLIKEMARVLKPGGVAAHIIETDSLHSAMVATKRNTVDYRRLIVDQDGHIGLELAEATLSRFEKSGFRLSRMRLVDALAPSVQYYEKYLDHEEFGKLPGLGWTRFLKKLNDAGPFGNLAYEFGFGAFHRTFEQWLGQPRRANFIHVAFVKA